VFTIRKKIYIVIPITYCQVKLTLWRNPWDYTKIFEELDREFSDAEQMLSRMFRTVREPNPTFETFPYYYGYQITIGPDGRPRIREFGNARPASKGLMQQSAIREPLVDTSFDEKDNLITITAEMPGITKQDVKVELAEGLVTIHAEKGDKKYHTEVPVDEQLDADSAKATYTNGILELKIKSKKLPRPKAKEIKVD
jgi:HSP20 family protein